MSDEDEEIDLDDEGGIIKAIETSSDNVLLINMLAGLVQIHPKDGKGTKKLKLYLQALTDCILKVSNDFRSLIKYMNIMEMIEFDAEDAPKFQSVNNDQLFI